MESCLVTQSDLGEDVEKSIKSIYGCAFEKHGEGEVERVPQVSWTSPAAAQMDDPHVRRPQMAPFPHYSAVHLRTWDSRGISYFAFKTFFSS
jgi:hypothetical protein